MCGFVGFLSKSIGTQGDDAMDILRSMADRIVHRGPDDAGYWVSKETGVALGHRRLAIVDLSPAGHQPMLSSSGRYVIAFNGEIYNHQDLRRDLERSGQGRSWRGHSDTETLVECFDVWGIKSTLQRAVGMFAFAAWDKLNRKLTLARDRFGEKPLYYGWQNGSFLFGSDLSSLRAHPAFDASLDRDSVTLLLRHNYIPAPYSIYSGIAKLQPGMMLTIDRGAGDSEVKDSYWSFHDVARVSVDHVFTGNDSEAIERLESVLMDAIGLQMVADVPLGAFLSGGIDSSTIVALMQVQSNRPVKTFSIGFHEKGYNEAVHAKAVATHLGTEHTELYVTPAEMLSVVPKLSTIYSEPFSDSSQIPTYLVSAMARQHVTVSLSGDGGDELFGGYSRYQQVQRFWRKLSLFPPISRKLLSMGLSNAPVGFFNLVGSAALSLRGNSGRQFNLGDKLNKLADVVGVKTFDDLYRHFVSHSRQPHEYVIGASEPRTILSNAPSELNCLTGTARMMALDTLSYLSDDILTKVDRAAMGVSLETRVPMLDHRVVEFAWTLPESYRFRDGLSKWILRQVLYRHVPRQLIDRPKMGFGVPLNEWLRTGLRDWAENLLSPARLQQQGLLDVKLVSELWAEHVSGQRNWGGHLWDILMLQSWLDTQKQ